MRFTDLFDQGYTGGLQRRERPQASRLQRQRLRRRAPGDVRGPSLKRANRNMPSQARSVLSGLLGAHGAGGSYDANFYGKVLEEIGEFNPVYVPGFAQLLMLRNPLVRLARVIIQAALESRTFSLLGGERDARRFHQAWIDRAFSQVLSRIFNATWFGYQPFVVDWSYERRWPLEGPAKLAASVPVAFHDLAPLRAHLLEDDQGRPAGIQQDGEGGGCWPDSRTFVMTWMGDWGNPYGDGNANAAYADWYAYSVERLWHARYLEKSAEPILVVFAGNKTIALGADEEDELSVIAGEIMDGATAGDIVVLPGDRDEEGKRRIELEQIKVDDRSDIYLRATNQAGRNILRASLMLPTSGLDDEGQVTYAGDREAKDTQWLIWDLICSIAVKAMNGVDGREGLIERVHRLNRLPGAHPRLQADPFKQETQEMLSGLLGQAFDNAVPELVAGEMTGRRYRPQDAVDWEQVFSRLRVPSYDSSLVARDIPDEPGPGVGGRPAEPFGERADDRHHGLER